MAKEKEKVNEKWEENITEWTCEYFNSSQRAPGDDMHISSGDAMAMVVPVTCG